MSTRLTFWGVAGYEIESPGMRVVVDPFLRGNRLAPVTPEEVRRPDLILVTHAASDHLGDAAEIAIATGAPVLCGGDVRHVLIDRGVSPDQVRATIWGLVTEIGGIRVRAVECHHWSTSVLSTGQVINGQPLAFILETEPGVRIYHYGDSAIFDMRLIGELYRPTVGLLGCTQPTELLDDVPGPGTFVTGEMTPDEAARVAAMLGLRIAVACHYIERNGDVDEFLELVNGNGGGIRAVAPAVGQALVIDGEDFTLEGDS